MTERGSERPRGASGWRRPVTAVERRAAAAAAPGGGGLCPECVHLRLLRSERAVFLRCGLAESDPSYPRYPTLPVLACPGFAVSAGG